MYCKSNPANDPALVFVDLDIVGTIYTSTDIGVSWVKSAINALPCPDPAQPPAPLVPRDAGYTVGVVNNNVTGLDRLLVLGGDAMENNVY